MLYLLYVAGRCAAAHIFKGCFYMKRFIALFLAVVMLLPAGMSVAAAGLNIPTTQYEGKTYYDLSGKEDYFKAARYGIENRLTAVPVRIVYSKFPDYKSNNRWYCNVTNFDYTQEKLYYSYNEYSPSTVCMTGYFHDFENDQEYGNIEIEYIDSADELKKADKLLDAELAKVSSYAKADKIKYIAEYICKHVKSGIEEMPGGGYDTINGVYDLMTGVRTNVVCSSYAFLFQRFMERAGYKSYIATNDNHAWNVVELDGKWYGVDCTYGDEGSSMDSKYLFMGMDRLKGYIDAKGNVFAELEREKGCSFSATAYGAKATTSTTTTGKIPTRPTGNGTMTSTTTTGKTATRPTGNGTTTRGGQTVSTANATDAETSADATDTTASDILTANTSVQPSAVTVDIAENPEVTLELFDSIAQNGGKLVLQSESYRWSFDGNKLTTYDTATTLNTGIRLGEEVAQEDISTLEKLSEGESYFPFSFEHHGALPGEAEICIRVDEAFTGKTVDIYSVNGAGKAVLEGTGMVTADGELAFTTNHCSLWFIKESTAHGLSVGTILLIVAGCLAGLAAVGTGVYYLFIRRKKA